MRKYSMEMEKGAGALPALFATCICASVAETFIGLCWVVECFGILWFVSYVMSGLQCKSTAWPELFFPLC